MGGAAAVGVAAWLGVWLYRRRRRLQWQRRCGPAETAFVTGLGDGGTMDDDGGYGQQQEEGVSPAGGSAYSFGMENYRGVSPTGGGVGLARGSGHWTGMAVRGGGPEGWAELPGDWVAMDGPEKTVGWYNRPVGKWKGNGASPEPGPSSAWAARGELEGRPVERQPDPAYELDGRAQLPDGHPPTSEMSYRYKEDR